MNVEDALQMCSAPSLDFTGGEWCYAANTLAEEVERLRAQLYAANRVTSALDNTDPWDAISQAIYMGDRGQECVCSEHGGMCYMHAQQRRAEAALDAIRAQIEDRDTLAGDRDRYRAAIAAISSRAEAAEAEVTRLTNKLNEDSQNFEIECLKAERDRLEYRAEAAEAEVQRLREERDKYKRWADEEGARCDGQIDRAQAAEAEVQRLREGLRRQQRLTALYAHRLGEHDPGCEWCVMAAEQEAAEARALLAGSAGEHAEGEGGET